MNTMKDLILGLHPLERKVVPYLLEAHTVEELAAASKLKEVEAMRALQWLENKGCVKITTEEQETLELLEKGKQAKKELPEEHILTILKKQKELLVKDIPQHLPEYDKDAAGPMVGILKKLGVPFITTDKGTAFKWVDISIEIPARTLLDTIDGYRIAITEKNKEEARHLLKRQGYAQLITKKVKSFEPTTKGKQLATADLGKPAAEKLTHEMLASGTHNTFRPYDVTINVPARRGGRKHIVTEAIEYIRRIWLDMGFEEMAGDHVQTAFWDLDALFVPQDHPAREMQDTFYLEGKGTIDPAVFKKVKAAHETGGDTKSKGWGYEFRKEESERLLLRTHTTVLSAQTLHAIKEGAKRMPGKYFSVNKVYRNEALDWKHLFEFHQVEGIVVGEGLTLGHLKSYLRDFFGKMGFSDVRIRPGHFPYTEPSAEVDVWDSKRKTWVELGGSGIFRPEVTKTLTGKDVTVLAWGLGMERIIKEYYNLEDIRDLYRNDLEQLKNMKMWMK